MKTAISIAYGGVFVEAETCNEKSFLQLGLVCPSCHRSIFWVREQQRISSKGNPFGVGAYFCHPKMISYEEALLCAERVLQISKKEREENIKKAERQRLKLFETWFWQIMSSHWIHKQNNEEDLSHRQIDLLLLTGAIKSDDNKGVDVYFLSDSMLITINGFRKNINFVLDSLDLALATFSTLGVSGKTVKTNKIDINVFFDGNTPYQEIVDNLGLLAGEPMHRQVAREAVLYLGAKNNRHLVKALLMSCYVTNDLLILDREKFSDYEAAIIFYRLVGFIFAIIPWANEFSKLSNRTGLPILDPSYTGTALIHLLDNLSTALGDSETDSITVSSLLLSMTEDIPKLVGLDFGRDRDEEKYIRSTNQIQYDGGKLMQSLSSKRLAKGFGK